jgi:hypothetical protein
MSGNDGAFNYRVFKLVGAAIQLSNVAVEKCIRAIVRESVRVDDCGVLAFAMAVAANAYRRFRMSVSGYVAVTQEELFKTHDSISHLTFSASCRAWLDLAGYSEQRDLSKLLSDYKSNTCSVDDEGGDDEDDGGEDDDGENDDEDDDAEGNGAEDGASD